MKKVAPLLLPVIIGTRMEAYNPMLVP